MPIDVIKDKKLTVGEVARLFPGHNGSACLNTQTVRNWMIEGVEVGDIIVKLESIKIRGMRYTTEEALRLFVERCNAPAGDQPERSEVQRDQDQRDAEEALRKMGVIVGPF